MSEETVELNLRVIDAFNRRDLGAYLELTDPDVEAIPYEVKIQGGSPYRGHSRVSEVGGKRPSRFSRISRGKSRKYAISGIAFWSADAFSGGVQGAARRLNGRCGWSLSSATRRWSGGPPLRARSRPWKAPDRGLSLRPVPFA
jgi:hypothetical protein